MPGETSRQNGKLGGRHKGGKASHTLKAQEVRKLLVEEISIEALPLIRALIKKGKAGDVKALQEIFNRSMGKVADNLKVDFKNPLLQVLIEIANEDQPIIKQGEEDNKESEEQEVEAE